MVGAAQGGVFIGLLLAPVFAGSSSDLAGWQAVYLCAAAMRLALALPLWRQLPAAPATAPTSSYSALLRSMLSLLLRRSCITGARRARHADVCGF